MFSSGRGEGTLDAGAGTGAGAKGAGGLKSPACDGGGGKALECSPTEFGWHLSSWNKTIACSAGEIGFGGNLL